MLLAFFNGTTPSAIARRIEKLDSERDAIRTTVDRAIADRTAGIEELRADLLALAEQRSKLG